MSNEPKKVENAKVLQIECGVCGIHKEVELKEENMPHKELGLWPFYMWPHIYCSKCQRLASTTIKE